MPLILPGNVASTTAATGFDVDNSCRLDGTSSYMHKTPDSNSNRYTWTWSGWVKRSSNLAAQQTLFGVSAASGSYHLLSFDANALLVHNYEGTHLTTTATYRDVSAWYHIVLAVDTTQSTDTNRLKLYVNGTQVTSFSNSGYPPEDEQMNINRTVQHDVGNAGTSYNYYFSGYMAEVVFIDGLALAPTSFGEFDSDSPTIWKPIDVSGLTFGTNGFYLDFKASDNLGNDANGGTDWAEANLAATDQATDSATNNFATMNFLDNTEGGIATFSEGNCKILTDATLGNRCRSTVGLTTGKWYVEVKITSAAHLNYQTMGFTKTSPSGPLGDNWLGGGVGDVSYYSNDGKIYNTGNSVAGTAHGATATTGDIIGCFLDLDNNTANFYKNGAQQNSGTGYDISSINGDTDEWFFACGDAVNNANTAELELNFGNPSYAPSSAVSDANGYGSFEYTPSVTTNGAAKDYLAICTKNLAEYG